MLKMGEASLRRGEKWTKLSALAEFEDRTADVEWLKTQPSVVADMKEYADSLVVLKETKPKVKK